MPGRWIWAPYATIPSWKTAKTQGKGMPASSSEPVHDCLTQSLRKECSLRALPPIFLVLESSALGPLLALCSCVLLGFTHPRKLKCPSLNFFASSICLSRSLPCLFIRMSTSTSNSPIKHEITLTSTPALFISFVHVGGHRMGPGVRHRWLGSAVSTFTHWVISPAPNLFLLNGPSPKTYPWVESKQNEP